MHLFHKWRCLLLILKQNFQIATTVDCELTLINMILMESWNDQSKNITAFLYYIEQLTKTYCHDKCLKYDIFGKYEIFSNTLTPESIPRYWLIRNLAGQELRPTHLAVHV